MPSRSHLGSAVSPGGNVPAALRILALLVVVPLLTVSAGGLNSTILIGKSEIDIVVKKRPSGIFRDGLLDWVRSAAQSVAAYYGRFPASRVVIRITPVEGRGLRDGMTFGEGGGLITIHVGADTTPLDFRSDWLLTHEMVHLAFPSVAEDHHWIEEGIATYVEPIARVRARQKDASQMWYELVRDLSQGLPAPGDKGLDHTHTWGRTYWGGALYCLLADVEIHRQTENKKGLDDALRAILEAGGVIGRNWELRKALSIGDRATGVQVLTTLYDKMKDRPVDVDLGALWKELGIERDGEGVLFSDAAPLAATRRAMTYGESHSPLESTGATGATNALLSDATRFARLPLDSIATHKQDDTVHPSGRTSRE